jgi:hypothetical protein
VRHREPLERASHPGLKLTHDEPPKGVPAMDADHSQQSRCARDRVRWYADRAAGKPP